MLADIDLQTVDFQPNYDDRLLEPLVLPGKFPNLLVNGGVGIAVGMATSLVPHNPTEILDAIIRVIENPAITLHELMTDVKDAAGDVVRFGVKGPDFPTWWHGPRQAGASSRPTPPVRAARSSTAARSTPRRSAARARNASSSS